MQNEMGGEARLGPAGNLLRSLRTFAGTFVGLAHTRLELLTTELQEEVRQVGAVLLWAFVAAFAAMMALFLCALAVIFVFWDTHRGVASVAMILMFVAIAVSAALIMRGKLRARQPLLNDTLAELARDRDQLRAQL